MPIDVAGPIGPTDRVNGARRGVLGLAALCAAAALPEFAVAQVPAYPTKPVKVVSPFPPGGGLDAVLRPLLLKMGENLGQNFYVDNRAGANGIIGIESVVRSPADGYTLAGVTSGAITINPGVYSKMPYDTGRDLLPVVNLCSGKFMLVVHPSVPAQNAKELIAWLKTTGGSVGYGTAGVGGPHHLGMEYFKQLTGTQMVHVPYRGSQPMQTDLIGGQVKVAFDSVMGLLPWVRNGKLRAIGVASATRSGIAPDIPTLAESGGPAFELNSWYGLMAPASTPPDIVARLNAEAVKALADPQVRSVYATMGVDTIGNTPAQFAAQIREDTIRWAAVAKAANIHAD